MSKIIFPKSVFLFCIIFFLGCSSTEKFKEKDIKSISFDQKTYSVIILGSGIAGLSSSIYLAQANLKPLVIEGDLPGGAITASACVRNWPSQPEISGFKLTKEIRFQAEMNGVKFISDKVVDVDFSNWPYIVKTKRDSFKALSVIIAMGATPNYLNIEGERGTTGYWGKGVSNCAICDGGLYKDKIVAIVGGGNAAITEASYLANLAKKVYILVRKDKLKASGKLVDNLLKLPNIEILYNCSVKKINGDGNSLKNITIFNSLDNKENNLEIDGLFLAIGSMPNSDIFKDKLKLDEQGHIILENMQETSVQAVFAAGDIANPNFKQAILAAGDGAKAALQAQKFLEKIGYSISKN